MSKVRKNPMKKKRSAKINGRSSGRKSTVDEFKYEIVVWWSAADDAFLAQVPELPGCMADGPTYQEAVANAEVVMREWI